MNNLGDVYVYNQTRDRFVATEVVVAATYWSRLIGLLGKTAAWSRPGRGLWLVPARGIHTFGVMFPTDVLFLDQELSVILVEEHIRPFSLSRMCFKARSALQLPAHTAFRTGTKVGDRLEIAHIGYRNQATSGSIHLPQITRQADDPPHGPADNRPGVH